MLMATSISPYRIPKFASVRECSLRMQTAVADCMQDTGQEESGANSLIASNIVNNSRTICSLARVHLSIYHALGLGSWERNLINFLEKDFIKEISVVHVFGMTS